MTRPFDMALFLSGVLTGSKITQQQHLRQARIMQAAIQQRWQRESLDLAAQACALISHSAPEGLFRRHLVLLSTHHRIDLEAIRE